MIASIKIDYSIGLIFIMSLSLILAALAFQYLGGLPPCDLCYKQRWAYYLAISIAPIALFFHGRNIVLFSQIILYLLAAVFFANMVLGIYHAGVEWSFWDGPSSCSDLGLLDPSIDLIDAIKKSKVVPCDQVQWTFLGLSMAFYSALASLGLCILSLLTARACEQYK